VEDSDVTQPAWPSCKTRPEWPAIKDYLLDQGSGLLEEATESGHHDPFLFMIIVPLVPAKLVPPF
jgi:hypothetical protein